MVDRQPKNTIPTEFENLTKSKGAFTPELFFKRTAARFLRQSLRLGRSGGSSDLWSA